MKYLKPGILFFFIFLFCISGCGKGKSGNTEEALRPTGIMVPASDVSSIFLDVTYVEAECLTEDTFYYVKKVPGADEDEFAEVLLQKRVLDDFDSEETLWRRTNDSEGTKRAEMILDEAGNLYEFFSGEANGEEYFIRKWNREGKQIYEIPIAGFSEQKMGNMAGGAANAEGELVLYNWDGKLFCFDKEGKMTHSLQINTAYLEEGNLFCLCRGFFLV